MIVDAPVAFTDILVQEKAVVFAMPTFRGTRFAAAVVGLAENHVGSESGSNLTIIDPLLNTFDLRGICSRSRGSNGDEAKHMLHVKKVESDLQLLVVSVSPRIAQSKGFVSRKNISMILTVESNSQKAMGFHCFHLALDILNRQMEKIDEMIRTSSW
jgi:hypothetical protein